MEGTRAVGGERNTGFLACRNRTGNAGRYRAISTAPEPSGEVRGPSCSGLFLPRQSPPALKIARLTLLPTLEKLESGGASQDYVATRPGVLASFEI